MKRLLSFFKLGIVISCILIPLISQGETMTFKPQEPKEPMAFESGKTYKAVITTSKGVITATLNTEKAPLSVTNFVQLANAQFYNGLTFHRVVPGFVIQGGDPDGTGTGGPGYTVKGEVNNGLKHDKGALAWARTSDAVNPERRSSGSQFYITLDATPHLDGQYTVFGQTTSGQDVVEKIAAGDKIEKVEIVIE